MEAQVILYKRGDEVVTVIISRLNTQRHRPRFLARGFCQYRRLQLVGKKLIIIALIDKRRDRILRVTGIHQCATVPFQPCIFVLT